MAIHLCFEYFLVSGNVLFQEAAYFIVGQFWKLKKIIFSHIETISVFLASIWWSKMFIKYSTVERNSIAVLWHGMTKEVAVQYLQSLRWKFLGALEITDGFQGPLPAGSARTDQDTRLNTYCTGWGNDATRPKLSLHCHRWEDLEESSDVRKIFKWKRIILINSQIRTTIASLRKLLKQWPGLRLCVSRWTSDFWTGTMGPSWRHWVSP